MNYEYFQWDWFGINILAPVVGPLIVLWFFSLPKNIAPLTKHIVIKSIGRGELFWAVMGMAAATCYDLNAFTAIATNATSVKIANWAYVAHLLVILFAVIMVGLNSLEPIPAPLPAPPPPPPTLIPDKFIFGASIVCLLLVIGTYSAVHTRLVEEEANVRKAAIIKIQKCVASAEGNAKHCMEDIK